MGGGVQLDLNKCTKKIENLLFIAHCFLYPVGHFVYYLFRLLAQAAIAHSTQIFFLPILTGQQMIS